MRLIFVSAALLALLAGCAKEETVASRCDCATDGGLPIGDTTTAAIYVHVRDAGGQPVRLDASRTLRLSDSSVVVSTTGPSSAGGYYLLLGDNARHAVSLCGETFLFQGFQAGALVTQREYGVRNNCYHIQLVSGDTEIQL